MNHQNINKNLMCFKDVLLVCSLICTVLSRSLNATASDVPIVPSQCEDAFKDKANDLLLSLNRPPIFNFDKEEIAYIYSKRRDLHPLTNSQLFKDIKSFIEAAPYSADKVLERDGRKFILRTGKVGQGQQFLESTIPDAAHSQTTAEVILLSTTELSKNNSVLFDEIQIGSGGIALITAHRFGSIDQRELYVFDINSKKILGQPIVMAHENDAAWISPNSFIVNGEEKRNSIHYYTIQDGKITSQNYAGSLQFAGDPNSYVWTGNEFRIFNFVTGEKSTVGRNFLKPIKVMGDFKGDSYSFASDGNKKKVIQKIRAIKGQVSIVENVTPSLEYDDILNAWVDDNYLFYVLAVKGSSTLVIADLETSVTKKVEIPVGATLTNVKLRENKRFLKLSFMSAVHSKIALTYDLNYDTFKDSMDLLFKSDSIEVVSKVINYKSFDGTDVPMLVTYRKDSPPKSDTPVYMEVYGGFNRSSRFQPSYSGMSLQFIKDGGMLAFPAVRGGNEMGPSWSEAASGTNKVKTYEDTAAAAQFLIEKGWTSKEHISLMGSSNGGLTVLASGLKYSQYFGLLIPVNGVDNIEKFETLDPVFGGSWRSDYGSLSENEIASMWDKYAPLKNVANLGTTNVLVVNGRMDTRVNPHHSVDVALALEKYEKSPDQVNLLSVDKAGHFSTAPPYNGYVGSYTAAVIWASIYKQNGMTFQSSKPK